MLPARHRALVQRLAYLPATGRLHRSLMQMKVQYALIPRQVDKIQQAARLGLEQYSTLLADAQADLAAVERSIQDGGVRMAGLQGEIDRLHREITALGAVNLAALEELLGAREAALTEMRSRGVMVLDVLPNAAASALVERYYLLKRKGTL